MAKQDIFEQFSWTWLRLRMQEQMQEDHGQVVTFEQLDAIWASTSPEQKESIYKDLADQVRDGLSAVIFGQHEAGWLSFYNYFHDVCGCVEETKSLTGMWHIAQSAGWLIPHEHVCWICDRPNVLNRDEQGRLDARDTCAIGYRDDFKLYSSHGVLLPADIIEDPSSITVGRIDTEPNAEVRRVMVEKYGVGRYLLDGKAEKLGSDDFGTLYRKPQPGDEDIVMVKVVNSTAEPDGSFRDYFLRVQPQLRPLNRGGEGKLGEPQEMTAKNAVASTFGKYGREYHPMFQT